MNQVFGRVALMVVLASMGTACGARMAVIGHEKQAYMVKESALGFNSDMYFCDASSGKPVCHKTQEGE